MRKRIISAVLMTAMIAFNVCSAAHFQADEEPKQPSISAAESEKEITLTAKNRTENTEEPANDDSHRSDDNRADQTVKEGYTSAPAESLETTKAVRNEISTEHTAASEPDKNDEKPVQITVKLSVNCTNAVEYGADVPEYFFKNQSYTTEEGATVFDVLKALCDENGLSLKYQRKTYIQGIGGLNEKDCGGASGWKYLVNGEMIMKPASSYKLKNGDAVEWRYIINAEQ